MYRTEPGRRRDWRLRVRPVAGIRYPSIYRPAWMLNNFTIRQESKDYIIQAIDSV
jgi:hypothetical protein